MKKKTLFAVALAASVTLTGCFGTATPPPPPPAESISFEEEAAVTPASRSAELLDEVETKRAELELLLEQKAAEDAAGERTSFLRFLIPVAKAEDDASAVGLDDEIAELIAEIQSLTEAAAAAAVEETDPAIVAELLDEVATVSDAANETVALAATRVIRSDLREAVEAVHESRQAFRAELHDARAHADEALRLGVPVLRLALETGAAAARVAENPLQFFVEKRAERLEDFAAKRAERTVEMAAREAEIQEKIAALPAEEQAAALEKFEEKKAEGEAKRAEREAVFLDIKNTVDTLNAAREAGDTETVEALKTELQAKEEARRAVERAERELEKVRREETVRAHLEALPPEAQAAVKARFDTMQAERRARETERATFQQQLEQEKNEFRAAIQSGDVEAAKQIRTRVQEALPATRPTLARPAIRESLPDDSFEVVGDDPTRAAPAPRVPRDVPPAVRVDANRDGVITPREIERAAEKREEMKERMDANNDGRVQPKELERAMEKREEMKDNREQGVVPVEVRPGQQREPAARELPANAVLPREPAREVLPAPVGARLPEPIHTPSAGQLPERVDPAGLPLTR